MTRFSVGSPGIHAIIRLTALVGFVALAIDSAAAAATNVVTTGNVRATLVSEVAAVKPGSAFWVGLYLKLRPHWHTYWSNPGDSGLAPRIDWQLPEGMVAGTIRYPLPQRFVREGIATYGYDNEVVLLTRMSALPAVTGQRKLALRAKAHWLVCEKVCIPEEGEFELSLPISAGAPAAHADKSLIERYVAALPASMLEAGFTASAARLQLRVRLSGNDPGISKVSFFPTEYGVVEHAAEQSWRRVDKDVDLVLARGELKGQALKRLTGVLSVADDKGVERGYLIDALPR